MDECCSLSEISFLYAFIFLSLSRASIDRVFRSLFPFFFTSLFPFICCLDFILCERMFCWNISLSPRTLFSLGSGLGEFEGWSVCFGLRVRALMGNKRKWMKAKLHSLCLYFMHPLILGSVNFAKADWWYSRKSRLEIQSLCWFLFFVAFRACFDPTSAARQFK